MAETVNEGVDLELEAQSRSGASGGSGDVAKSGKGIIIGRLCNAIVN
jgi:hypothetical protein